MENADQKAYYHVGKAGVLAMSHWVVLYVFSTAFWTSLRADYLDYVSFQLNFAYLNYKWYLL